MLNETHLISSPKKSDVTSYKYQSLYATRNHIAKVIYLKNTRYNHPTMIAMFVLDAMIIIIIIQRVYIALYIKIYLKALLKHTTLKILVKIQTIIAHE